MPSKLRTSTGGKKSRQLPRYVVYRNYLRLLHFKCSMSTLMGAGHEAPYTIVSVVWTNGPG